MDSQTLTNKAYYGPRGLVPIALALGLAACALSNEGLSGTNVEGGPSDPANPSDDSSDGDDLDDEVGEDSDEGQDQAGGVGGVGGGGGAGSGGAPGGAVTGGAGGTPNNGGSTGGAPSSGTGGTMAGTGGTPGMEMPMPAPSGYSFETGTQGWRDLKDQGSQIRRTEERAAVGTASLEVVIDTRGSGNTAGANERYIGLAQDAVPRLRRGQSVSMQVWLPADAAIVGLQAFVVTEEGLQWEGEWRPSNTLMRPGWNQVTLRVSEQFDVDKLLWFGVQFMTNNGGWRGSVFIDDVRW